MDNLLNASNKISTSRNVDSMSTDTADILFGGQYSTDILLTSNKTTFFNASQSDLFSLFVNFTIATLEGHLTDYTSNDLPYETRLIF